VHRFVETANNPPERQKIDGESLIAMTNAGLVSSYDVLLMAQ
jgi:hypothetical protein